MNKTADLLIEYIPRLRRYAHALTRETNRADDLVQDCLARAIARIHLWQPDTDIRAWLFTIMHNLYLNECRKQTNQPSYIPTDELPESGQPGYEAEHELRLLDLQAALFSLPPEQREIILLVSLEGMSYQQTADILAIPKGTVMSRLYRGREQLRKLMDYPTEKTPGLRRIK